MFRVSTTPITRSTQNCNYSLRHCGATCLQCDQTSLSTLEGGSCRVPEAVVTVLCTPDDGCGWHSKHIDWTWRIINRLLCVASRWTIININIFNLHALCYITTYVSDKGNRLTVQNFKYNRIFFPCPNYLLQAEENFYTHCLMLSIWKFLGIP